MKKIFLIAMAIITLTMSAQAQAYRDSRYYNNSTGRLEYTYHHHDGVIGTGDVYYGLRLDLPSPLSILTTMLLTEATHRRVLISEP